MQTPARSPALVRRQAALTFLPVLALLAVPPVARAADPVCTPRIVLSGHHQPVAHVAHVAHAVRASVRSSLRHAAHRHGVAPVHRHSWSEDGFRWSLYDGTSRSTTGASDEEIRDVIAARGAHSSFLWFSQDGQRWVVRDPALVARAHESIEPMERLGKEMGRLGGEMGQLGARQGRFGAEMGRLGARQGALAARLALLELRDYDDPGIEREIAAIERKMDELSRRQDEFSRRQESLGGERMDELGDRMGELGDRMERLAERAERELKALAKEAISSRKAERLGDRGDL